MQCTDRAKSRAKSGDRGVGIDAGSGDDGSASSQDEAIGVEEAKGEAGALWHAASGTLIEAATPRSGEYRRSINKFLDALDGYEESSSEDGQQSRLDRGFITLDDDKNRHGFSIFQTLACLLLIWVPVQITGIITVWYLASLGKTGLALLIATSVALIAMYIQHFCVLTTKSFLHKLNDEQWRVLSCLVYKSHTRVLDGDDGPFVALRGRCILLVKRSLVFLLLSMPHSLDNPLDALAAGGSFTISTDIKEEAAFDESWRAVPVVGSVVSTAGLKGSLRSLLGLYIGMITVTCLIVLCDSIVRWDLPAAIKVLRRESGVEQIMLPGTLSAPSRMYSFLTCGEPLRKRKQDCHEQLPAVAMQEAIKMTPKSDGSQWDDDEYVRQMVARSNAMLWSHLSVVAQVSNLTRLAKFFEELSGASHAAVGLGYVHAWRLLVEAIYVVLIAAPQVWLQVSALGMGIEFEAYDRLEVLIMSVSVVLSLFLLVRCAYHWLYAKDPVLWRRLLLQFLSLCLVFLLIVPIAIRFFKTMTCSSHNFSLLRFQCVPWYHPQQQ